MQTLASALITAVLLVVASGCGSPEEDGALVAAPDPGAPPPPGGPCEDEGESCRCEGSGVFGTYVCEDEALVCDCSACPGPDGGAVEFSACGGEVWGAWRLIETRTGTGTIYFRSSSGSEKSCSAGVVHGGRRELRIAFLEGGQARVVADEAHSETVTFSDECAEPATCENTTFTTASPFEQSPSGFDAQCASDECDTCTCRAQVSNHETYDTDWRFVGNQVQLGSEAFAYCVADGLLTLQVLNEAFVFEAVEVVGVPTACEQRSPGLCGIGQGCESGQCSGTSADCEGETESRCSTYPGCTWDPDACLGEAPLECSLEDADIVPGCELEPL